MAEENYQNNKRNFTTTLPVSYSESLNQRDYKKE